MYLALTCKRLRGEEAFVSGLATHYVTVGDGSVSKFLFIYLHKFETSGRCLSAFRLKLRCCILLPLGCMTG